MTFISTSKAAENWGISANRISILAREGRIPGAVQVGMRWLIPENAEKPADGRTRSVKSVKTAREEVDFRFPLFVNFEEKDYTPPLSDEELMLRRAQKEFQACRFAEANNLLRSLENAENRYVRLSAIYHKLCIAVYENNSDFEKLLWKLNSELSQNFPYKKEMLMLRYGFDADNVSYKSILEEFAVDPDYKYHPSADFVMALVSFIPIENGDFSLMSKLRYDTQELICQQCERSGHYLEAQKMHYLLSVAYQLQNKTEKMEAHIRRGLILAVEHELYFVAAFYERWYRIPTRKVLLNFPADFSEKIRELGSYIQKKQALFEKSNKKTSYISMLSGKEFEYAFLANQDYTNREIAKMMRVSEKTVSRMYSEIYNKLGVQSKQELVELINGMHSGRQV